MAIVASMNYVNGQAVRLTIHVDRKTGDLYIPCRWFDHGDYQLEQLLANWDIPASAISEARLAQDEANAEWRAEQEKNNNA